MFVPFSLKKCAQSFLDRINWSLSFRSPIWWLPEQQPQFILFIWDMHCAHYSMPCQWMIMLRWPMNENAWLAILRFGCLRLVCCTHAITTNRNWLEKLGHCHTLEGSNHSMAVIKCVRQFFSVEYGWSGCSWSCVCVAILISFELFSHSNNRAHIAWVQLNRIHNHEIESDLWH